jgi:putative ABC transport system permease protein
MLMPFGPILRSLRHNKTRFVLIVLEIAFTLAIVSNCVNMILASREGMLKQSGFDDDHLVYVQSQHYTARADSNVVAAAIERDLRALRAVPGVRDAANTYFLPWQGGGSSDTFRGANGASLQAQTYPTSPGIFDTLGVKVVEGRGFTAQDYPDPTATASSAGRNVVISRAFENLLFPNGGRGVGQLFQDSDGVNYRIVGIIDKFYNPYGWPIGDFVVFTPAYAGNVRGGSGFLVRTGAEPRQMTAAIEKALLAAENDRVLQMFTVPEMKDAYFAGGRLVVKAMTAIILLVVFVTGIGILGLTSLSVTERTRQIGTRRALGATRRDILTHFVLENWMVTTAGLLLGIVLTYSLNFVLVTRVANNKMDWRLVAVGMLLLWANGLAATMFPALRASRFSPAIATKA